MTKLLKRLHIWLPDKSGQLEKQSYCCEISGGSCVQQALDIVRFGNTFEITMDDDFSIVISSPYYDYLEKPINSNGESDQ